MEDKYHQQHHCLSCWKSILHKWLDFLVWSLVAPHSHILQLCLLVQWMQATEIAKAPAVAQKKMAAFISTPWILSQEILNKPILWSCKQVIKNTQLLKNKTNTLNCVVRAADHGTRVLLNFWSRSSNITVETRNEYSCSKPIIKDTGIEDEDTNIEMLQECSRPRD